ncbi:MAG: TauD/TfdA family dioxygenase [Burkholderiaceae bacterium]|nr:TauD/TfdA family dioxygenase [Burkholderiaceae bacterium]
MKISACDAVLGAHITDVDLSRPISELDFRQIADAFATHAVVVVRSQRLREQDQIAFARRFGELEIMKVYQEFVRPDHPEVFVVSNVIENGKPIGLQEAGRMWHTDGSFRPKPPMGSLLYAIEIPVRDGTALGDTLFASTCAAYDALDDAMKRRLGGLQAVHRLEDGRSGRKLAGAVLRETLTEAQKRAVQELVHPVVRTHPVTGRRCLYVNEQFTSHIVGMPEAQSSQLIRELCDHITQPRFIYRHRWQVGDLVIWDNCSSQHQALGDYEWPMRRLMHRITVQGTVPV